MWPCASLLTSIVGTWFLFSFHAFISKNVLPWSDSMMQIKIFIQRWKIWLLESNHRWPPAIQVMPCICLFSLYCKQIISTGCFFPFSLPHYFFMLLFASRIIQITKQATDLSDIYGSLQTYTLSVYSSITEMPVKSGSWALNEPWINMCKNGLCNIMGAIPVNAPGTNVKWSA